MRARVAGALSLLSLLGDSLLHVAAVLLITSLYYISLLRRLVLLLPVVPFTKRVQLVALYLEVPIVRRAAALWGVADVFPGFMREMARGALRTTAFSMQPGVVRAPFCFVPSVEFEASRSRLPREVLALREHTDDICGELDDLIRGGVPFDEFFGTWRFFAFFEYGLRLRKHIEQAPKTAALMEGLPTLLRNSQCGFSVLAANDCIGAHCDAHATNLRLRVHLGLRNCDEKTQKLKVGQAQQHWRKGELLVLDTTFQHSATNAADEDRVVLLFDIWHPSLGAKDLAALAALDAFFDH